MKRNILERALAGEKFDDLHIVDAHCHMGTLYNFYFPKADIEEMIQDADILGVEKMCIAPHAAISCDYRFGNRQLLEAINKYPDRVNGLLTCNPNFPEDIDEQFNSYYQVRQFTGVKIHNDLHSYPVNGENCLKIFEKVRLYGGYVLAHTWESSQNDSINMCEEVIRNYPDMAFILGHAGGLADGISKSIKVVNTYENAYLDTSGFEFSNTWIEEIAAKADVTKILFSSDCPFHDLRGGISRVLFADLDDDVKMRMLSGNYRELLLKYPKKVGSH
jgi:predicted TIM-barrel fold metal-dependent hydrolase